MSNNNVAFWTERATFRVEREQKSAGRQAWKGREKMERPYSWRLGGGMGAAPRPDLFAGRSRVDRESAAYSAAACEV